MGGGGVGAMPVLAQARACVYVAGQWWCISSRTGLETEECTPPYLGHGETMTFRHRVDGEVGMVCDGVKQGRGREVGSRGGGGGRGGAGGGGAPALGLPQRPCCHHAAAAHGRKFGTAAAQAGCGPSARGHECSSKALAAAQIWCNQFVTLRLHNASAK